LGEDVDQAVERFEVAGGGRGQRLLDQMIPGT